MSSRVFKAVALAGALCVAALSLAAPADARPRHHHGGGSSAAAAILGFGVGTIFGSAIAADRAYVHERRYYYRPPPPRYYRPARIYYAPAPWTPEWEAYCFSKHDYFDPRSGTYLAPNGYRYFCR